MKTPILLSSLGVAALLLTGCETEVVATRPVYGGGGYSGDVVYQERGPYVSGVIFRDGHYYRGNRIVYYDARDQRYYDHDRRNYRDNDRRDVTVVNVRNPRDDRDREDHDRRNYRDNDRRDVAVVNVRNPRDDRDRDDNDRRDNDRPDAVVRTPQNSNESRRVTPGQRVEKRDTRLAHEEVKAKKTKKKTVEETQDEATEGQYQRKPR